MTAVAPAPPELGPYPSELNDELRLILGYLCFHCGPVAERLRQGGAAIENRAEAEQAFVIDWMLRLYLQHGAAWRAVARAELNAIQGRPAASGASEPTT